MKAAKLIRGILFWLPLGLIWLGGSAKLTADTWQLVWADEFDQPGLPDPRRWDYEAGFVRNHEKQIYTVGRAENARIEDGHLIIEARKELMPNPQFRGGEEAAAGSAPQSQVSYAREANATRPSAAYTSASLITRQRAEWRYGRIEVRARIPSGTGIWPAIWMLGTNRGPVPWPACGEIDIMESVGYDAETIHGNVHLPARYAAPIAGNDQAASKAGMKGSRVVTGATRDYKVYAIEWDAEAISCFADGQCTMTYRNPHTGVEAWPFDQPFYLLLNVAIGGPWAGKQGIDDRIFPGRMEVDYVRVYQKKP